MINIKVNGTNISIENSNVVTSDNSLDSLNKSIESLSNQIDKEYIALKLMSNIKAVESFGYISTESVGEKIKAGASRVWEAIKNFFIKIGKACKALWNRITGKSEKELIQQLNISEKEKQDLLKANKLSSDTIKTLNETIDKLNEKIKKLKDENYNYAVRLTNKEADHYKQTSNYYEHEYQKKI